VAVEILSVRVVWIVHRGLGPSPPRWRTRSCPSTLRAHDDEYILDDLD